MSVAGARCLVLGGGGFIGINLCLALAAAGAEVAGYGRRPHGTGVLDGYSWHDADFADADAVAAAVAGQDVVFHLLGGGIPARSNRAPVADVEASVVPSLRLIEACRAARVGRIVFASSGGTVYGPAAAVPTPEDAPTDPITAYGVNKLAVEKYLGLYGHLHGLRSVSLRIANPYGPHQRGGRPQGIVGNFLARALGGEDLELWGDGGVVRDLVHVGDVARAMVLAAGYAGPHRVFNVGSGVGRTMRAVAEAVAAATGLAPDRIRHLPGRQEDVPVNVLDIRRIGDNLGWRPETEWTAGLAATAAWMRVALAGGDDRMLPVPAKPAKPRVPAAVSSGATWLPSASFLPEADGT